MSRVDQYYVFTMDDEACPVWCEMFFGTQHVASAPTPFSTVEMAVAELRRLHPEAYVDELDDDEIADARLLATTF